MVRPAVIQDAVKLVGLAVAKDAVKLVGLAVAKNAVKLVGPAVAKDAAKLGTFPKDKTSPLLRWSPDSAECRYHCIVNIFGQYRC